MKHKYCIPILSLLISGCFISCGDELSTVDDIKTIGTEQEKITPSITLSQDEEILLTELSNKTPKISIEQAVEIADNFFNKSSSTASLSKSSKCLPEYEVITAAKKSIKKSASTDDTDTLMYIFNYNDGFAVVSADIRTPEQILAYSETGSLHSDTDNPGISLFLNMAQDYVQYSIDKAESMRDSLESSLDEKLSSALGLPADTVSSISKYKRVTSKTLVYTNIQSKHISTELVGPYIQTMWHQSDPYNVYLPSIGGKQCAAGCVAVAFSQLMAYWQWPPTSDDFYIFWSSILPPTSDNNDIADFIKTIGFKINTKYGVEHSSARTEDAIKLLKNYGYKTNDLVQYSSSEVRLSINNQRPVVIEGYCKEKSTNKKVGHCWLIDGYAIETTKSIGEQRYVIMYKDDVTGEISGELEVVPENSTHTYYYHHLNWGWGGNLNKSYYLESVFDMEKEYRIEAGKQPVHELTDYGDGEYDDFKYSLRIATNIYPLTNY